MIDLISNVIARFQADTADMKSGIKELQGYEKDLAQAQLEQATARNEQLDDWCKGLDKVQQGLQQVKQVADFVFDAWKMSIKETRLETAAMGVDIDALGRSAGGLKTHMELLEFAARANKAQWGLTTQEMMNVEGLMRVLTERGMDAAQAQDAVTNALVTGRTRGLEPYLGPLKGLGETVDMLGDKLSPLEKRQQSINNLLQVAAEAAPLAGKGMAAYGEEGESALVKLKDAWDETKVKIGEAADNLAPIAGHLADTVKQLLSLADALSKINIVAVQHSIEKKLGLPEDSFGSASGMLSASTSNGFMGAYSALSGNTSDSIKSVLDEYQKRTDEQLLTNLGRFGLAYFEEIKRDLDNKDKEAARLAKIHHAHKEMKDFILDRAVEDLSFDFKEIAAKFADLPENARQMYGSAVGAGIAGKQDQEAGSYGISAPKLDELQRQADILKGIDNAMTQSGGAAFESSSKTHLEKLFGPIDDFQAYEKAFQGLEHASTAAFNAWIEGSESAGSAFKKAIGKSIEALADQMLVEGLKYEAYAIGSLIPGPFFNPGAAAGYAATGAEFLAGAAIAGALAHEMGASWGVGSGSGGGGGGASGGGGGTSSSGSNAVPTNQPVPTGQQVIIVYGDTFYDSPYQRQTKAQQIVDTALGGSGGRPQ